MSLENNPSPFFDRFKQHINSATLWKSDDQLFLACSGGVDSVVLAHLLKSTGVQFELLHCNFNLRGAESNRDEEFVRALAVQLGSSLQVKSFDTKSEMQQLGKGVQETARMLRYNWFHEVVNSANPKEGNSWLLTAHHQGDQVETISMNFFRGTGIAGFHGILEKSNQLIRPLLSFTREEILEYAASQQISWVEDHTNADVHYTRNLFRHTILPEIKNIFPEVEMNIINTAKRLSEVEFLYRKQVDKIISGLLEKTGTGFKVPVKKLMITEPLDTILYELFKTFGFSVEQSYELKKLFTALSGKYIQSHSHRVLKNRDWLLIDAINNAEPEIKVIEEGRSEISFDGGKLNFKAITGDSKTTPNPNQAFIDNRYVVYPLLLRPWKQGDYFYPLGMKKKKKIARFLTDIKLSKKEKENQWVLESDRKIIWVVGRRIDDRVKVNQATTHVLFIELSV
jgi:tRNA(Ile)-lysidine synthase